MKDKTIDYVLRATWQAVSRMYNEEAAKYDATMATGFALLSIDKEDGGKQKKLFHNLIFFKMIHSQNCKIFAAVLTSFFKIV